MLSDKSFLGNSQRLSASRRCFCFQETRRREEEKSLCLPSVCVYMCASQDTEGMWDRGSTGCHFDRSLDPFSQCCHIFQRVFFIYFLLYDVCSDPVISIQQRFFFFFFSSSHKASGHFHALLGRCLTTKNISQLCFRMWFARVTLSNVCIRAPELAISWRTLLLNFNSGLEIVLFLVLFILG